MLQHSFHIILQFTEKIVIVTVIVFIVIYHVVHVASNWMHAICCAAKFIIAGILVHY